MFTQDVRLESKTLEDLSKLASNCILCKLCETRTKVVFSNKHKDKVDYMFIGEAPGKNEDETGLPFIGVAGDLLQRVIESGMKLTREDVYIANIVKCRPPDNRLPEISEIIACAPFLERQIELVNPKVIIALGKTSSNYLLNNRLPMNYMRGKIHRREPYDVIPTWHPAYLLRNPNAKQEFWDDIKLAMEVVNERSKDPS